MISDRSNTAVIILIISLAILSFAAGVSVWRVYQAHRQPVLQSLIVLPEPRSISDFLLIDQNGDSFTSADFKGHWSLVFFGFTSCPDVCPNTLYQLQQARQLIQEQHVGEDLPIIYLISVDPNRDTPEKLHEYLAYFDPAFVGLTGEESQLQALAMQLGIAFFVEPHLPGNVEYNVDHSSSILLLNPLAELYGVLPAPHLAGTIASDVMTVLF